MSSLTPVLPAAHAKTSSKSNSEKPSKKEKSPKVCGVCGDKSTGMHFGAITCEGCKGFFRRSVNKKGSFMCLFTGSCTINKLTRKHCQSCRYNMCLRIGMKSELVMSEQEVNEKRELIKKNREKRQEQQLLAEQEKRSKENEVSVKLSKEKPKYRGGGGMAPSKRLLHSPPLDVDREERPYKMSMDHKVLIEVLLKSHHKSYDFDYKEFESFRGLNEIISPGDDDHAHQATFAWLAASQENGSRSNHGGADRSRNTEGGGGSTGGANSSCSSTMKDALDDLRNVMSGNGIMTSLRNDVSFSLHGIENSQKKKRLHEAEEGKQQDGGTTSGQEQTKDLQEEAGTSSSGSSLLEDDKSSLHCLLRSQGFSLAMIKDSKSVLLLQHFCDIMSWGIKKVIEFCKGIPEFINLTLVDQIFLLKGGCLEMLVLRSYFAFSSNTNTYESDKFQYRPSDFLKAGGSSDFVMAYNHVHLRMRKLKLKVEEICLLLAIVLFSPDRQGLTAPKEIEQVQANFAMALQSYEYMDKPHKEALATYSEILLILPLLRSINKLFSQNIENLQSEHACDMSPLIFEVNKKTASEK